MTDQPPTLYVSDQDSPTTRSDAFRPATPEEIGEVARQYEETLRELLAETCTPIPVAIFATREDGHVVKIESELHARTNCDHEYPDTPNHVVFLDTTKPIYLIRSGELERGPLDA